VGVSELIDEALSYAPILEGSWPVTNDMREGAQRGEGQYAESKMTDFSASLSRLGVLICDLSFQILS